MPYYSVREVRRLLYEMGAQRFKDRVRLAWAEDAKTSNSAQWRALLALADTWKRPHFPLTGSDVMAKGVPEGPLVGRILGDVEAWWIDNDFPDDVASILERLKAAVQSAV